MAGFTREYGARRAAEFEAGLARGYRLDTLCTWIGGGLGAVIGLAVSWLVYAIADPGPVGGSLIGLVGLPIMFATILGSRAWLRKRKGC